MKRLMILIPLLLILIQVNAQMVYVWRDSVNVGAMVAADTVVYPRNVNSLPLNLGSCVFNVTVDAEFLNTNTTLVGIMGGGTKTVRTSNKVLKFDEVKIDTVQPYLLDKTKLDFIQRSGAIVDTTYMRTFWGDFFGYDMPGIRAIKGSTSGTRYLSWVWRFYKR